MNYYKKLNEKIAVLTQHIAENSEKEYNNLYLERKRINAEMRKMRESYKEYGSDKWIK